MVLYKNLCGANTCKHLLGPQREKVILISVSIHLVTLSGFICYENLDANNSEMQMRPIILLTSVTVVLYDFLVIETLDIPIP